MPIRKPERNGTSQLRQLPRLKSDEEFSGGKPECQRQPECVPLTGEKCTTGSRAETAGNGQMKSVAGWPVTGWDPVILGVATGQNRSHLPVKTGPPAGFTRPTGNRACGSPKGPSTLLPFPPAPARCEILFIESGNGRIRTISLPRSGIRRIRE